MKYQLVFQKAVNGEIADFDELAALQAKIESFLAHGAIIDGHDFGAGEGNIFIYTDHPKIIFKQIFGYLLSDKDKHQLKVASRDVDGEDWQILWPHDLTEFEVK